MGRSYFGVRWLCHRFYALNLIHQQTTPPKTHHKSALCHSHRRPIPRSLRDDSRLCSYFTSFPAPQSPKAPTPPPTASPPIPSTPAETPASLHPLPTKYGACDKNY